MYDSRFIDLVNSAFLKSEKLSNTEKVLGNPYYIGFGNPNSKVLVLGKEKGFNVNPEKEFEQEQFKFESLLNPNEWKYCIDRELPFNLDRTYESKFYLNCFTPYTHKNPSGHTWTKYEMVLKKVFPEITGFQNDFFKYTFISEVNFQPSKLSKIRRFNHKERLDFLSSDFYKSFPITILGCGNYLNREQVCEIFDVNHKLCLSKPRQKLEIYSNNNRILIQTRQLSFDIKNDYLDSIITQIKLQ